MWLRILRAIAWLAYVAGCLLILENSLRDHLPGGAGLFAAENGALGETLLWRTSLYLHVGGGMLCLLCTLTQFSKRLLSRQPWIHRYVGRVYGLVVIGLLAPTGFHLSFSAKGGFLGKFGFLTLTAATLITTLHGWKHALPRHRDLVAHREWMTRSFALVASAVTFRIFHTFGYLAGLPTETNYVICLWLSILGNAAVAEAVIRHRRQPVTTIAIPT